jgi:hypothetical protein
MFEQYESRGMAGNFDYRGINYDIVRKKQIEFSDYFRLDSPADSAFWQYIITQAVESPELLESRAGMLGIPARAVAFPRRGTPRALRPATRRPVPRAAAVPVRVAAPA